LILLQQQIRGGHTIVPEISSSQEMIRVRNVQLMGSSNQRKFIETANCSVNSFFLFKFNCSLNMKVFGWQYIIVEGIIGVITIDFSYLTASLPY
jgi:hypothetical protein